MDTPQTSPNHAGDAFSEQSCRALLESLTDYAIFMIDPGGTILTWNSGVLQVLGYDAATFIGLPFATLFTPDDVALGRPAEELLRAAATGRSEDHREHVRRDGTRFHAGGVVTAVRDNDGNVQGLCTIMHASAALRESEERYRLLVESIKDYASFSA